MSPRDPNKPSETGLSPMRSISIESPTAPSVGSPPRPVPSSPVSPPQVSPRSPAVSRSSAPVQGILATGSRFGAYVVGPCVGQGGMARVYSAQHEGLQRQVALKVLTHGLVGSDEHERFVREARLAAGIKHPNVVNIFDVGVEEGVPYLVMEFLEGEDLDTSLQTETSLSEDSIIDIMVPVVAGLTAVHDAGVIHRDLKPGNIFLTRGRHDEVEPKLLDFGISRSTCREDGKITSERGLLMGTPFYMAPETIRGAGITEVSDQYSLGVVMYECATGINPFAADSFAEVVERVTSGNYPPLSQCNTAVSPKLVRIVERAMSLDPNDRYADLRELGRDLLRLAGQRTRVTWGLTFGDMSSQLVSIANEPPPTGTLPSEAQDLAALAATTAPPRKKSGAVFAFLGAAAFLGAVMFGEDAIKEFAGQTSQPSVAQVRLTTAALPLARTITEAALVPDPVIENAIGGSAADGTKSDAIQAELAAEQEKRNSQEVAEKMRAALKAKRTSTARSKRIARRKRRRRASKKRTPKAVATSVAVVDSRPAWAPNGALAAEGGAGRPMLGTNNAPILD